MVVVRGGRRLSTLGLVTAFLFIGSSCSVASGATLPAMPLSTSGAKIVDANGQQVIVAGVNWFGFETHNHVAHGLWSRDFKDMLRQISSLGYNAIRLPFSIQAVRSSSFDGVDFGGGRNAELQGKTPLQAMEIVIDEANKNGLMVLLDNHSSSDDSFAQGLWYGVDGYTENDWIDNWKTLATRFKNKPNVIGADLKNEPHDPATWGTGVATDWRLAAERAGNAVGQIAPNWLIVVEGIGGDNKVEGQQLPNHWWGGNLEGVKKYPVRLNVANKLVYSPHEYGPGVFNQTWFQGDNFQATLYDRWNKGFQYIADTGAAPILVGEFGGKQVDTTSKEGIWQRQFMDFLRSKGDSWTYWAWNPNSGDTGGVLQDNWLTVNQAKQDLLNLLIARSPIPFPGSGTTPAPTPTTTTPTVTTPTTPTVTTPTATTPPPSPGAGVSVDAVIQSEWASGYCVYFKVTNNSTTDVTDWSVAFNLAGAQMTDSWNGTFSKSGLSYTVKPADWAKKIAPSKSNLDIGFCANKTSSSYKPTSVVVTSSSSSSPAPTPITTTTPTVTTPTTPTVTTPTTTTTPPPSPGAGVLVDVVIQSEWATGYCAYFKVTNNSGVSTNSWTVTFNLGGAQITSNWNGTFTKSGSSYTVKPADWAKKIAPSKSNSDIGFCADKTSTSYKPTSVAVSAG